MARGVTFLGFLFCMKPRILLGIMIELGEKIKSWIQIEIVLEFKSGIIFEINWWIMLVESFFWSKTGALNLL